MQFINLPHARIPALGLGTWQLQGTSARQIVKEAITIGYRHIDTAQMYDNEKMVGDAIQASSTPRGQLFVTTKVWWENLSERHFLPSVDESLRQLQMDYVDLLLIHWPHPSLPLDSYMEQLQRAREMGKARFIGVSNFTPSLLKQALQSGAALINNQVEYHPYLNQSATLKSCQENGLFLTAYCPIAKAQVIGDETIERIAACHGKSAVQVALRWLIQQPGVAAIPKTSKPANLRENFQIFDFELSPEEMKAISSLRPKDQRLVNPSFAPAW